MLLLFVFLFVCHLFVLFLIIVLMCDICDIILCNPCNALLRKGWCLQHERLCDMKSKVASIHIAGTPCTAYSMAGLMDGETADSYGHFLSWCGLRAEIEEPVIIQECTDDMPRDDFLSLLPMYHWDFIVLCPTQFGHPIRRKRQWAVSFGQKLIDTTIVTVIGFLQNKTITIKVITM